MSKALLLLCGLTCSYGGVHDRAMHDNSLFVFVITYNHGEGKGKTPEYRQKTEEALTRKIENAGSPDIIAMMSQEVHDTEGFLQAYTEQPFEIVMRSPPLSNDYDYVAHSDISGCTKCSTFTKVQTKVYVAIKKALVQNEKRDISIIAERCEEVGPEYSCDEKYKKTEKTRGRFYSDWGFHKTKGYAMVHVNVTIGKSKFPLRFVSVHLDTNQFQDNLLYAAKILKNQDTESEDAGAVTIVAGDFNNRIDNDRYHQVCPNGKLSQDSIKEALRMQGETHLPAGLRFDTLQDTFTEAGWESGTAVYVTPDSTLIQGVSYVLPTYSLAKPEADERAVVENVVETFKMDKVCDGRINLGVLDSIWYLNDPDRTQLSVSSGDSADVDAPAGWEKVAGSDHAMVIARIQISHPQSNSAEAR